LGGATTSIDIITGLVKIYMEEKRITTLGKHKKGQSMVEFALVIPVMVLLIAGIFDLGRAFYAAITITNAAREGARYGTLHPDDFAGMKSITILEAQDSNITLQASNVTITCPDLVDPAGCDRGEPLRVTTNYSYDDMIFQFLFPSGIQMNRYVEMLVP
jgi:Flp pilus assembly protein TadG